MIWYVKHHKNGQPAAIATAVMAKAKLFRLDVGRAVATLSRYELMTEEELRYAIAEIHAEARAIRLGKSN